MKINNSRTNMKLIIGIVITISIFYGIFSVNTSITNLDENSKEIESFDIHLADVYDTGYTKIENAVIEDTIFIMEDARVDIVNSTIKNSVYCFGFTYLNVTSQSNITLNLILSESCFCTIKNSTVGGNIECGDAASLMMSNCFTPSTMLWKFDYAFLDIESSTFNYLNDFGLSSTMYLANSTCIGANLNGASSSRVIITNSNIGTLSDNSKPYHQITTPSGFNLITFTPTLKTSERTVNFTWIGFDSPIIDNHMNITFQILVDNTPYLEVNGSGYTYDSGNMYEYVGSTIITFEETGMHNITLISIDGVGNNYTSSLMVEIINYPTFPWVYFGIGVGIFAGIALLLIFLLRHQTNRGYRDSLGIIYKKELAANKVKAIIFMAIGVAPGIVLSLFFGVINTFLHGISIDQVRTLITTIMNFYLIYFELIFTIVFASSSIINHKRDGSLSWFMSKPVRRWEFLWGKTLAYMTIGILVMIPTSISIVVSGLLYLDPIYITDMISIGGFIFIIGIATIIPLVAIGMLLSTLFKKSGLAIFIPIMMLVILPTIVGFLPILVRHEWPLLFSYSYYSEKLGMFWISQSGQGLSNIIGPYSQLLGITITTFGFTAGDILLILSLITIVSMIIATLYIRRIDI